MWCESVGTDLRGRIRERCSEGKWEVVGEEPGDRVGGVKGVRGVRGAKWNKVAGEEYQRRREVECRWEGKNAGRTDGKIEVKQRRV